MTLRSLLFVPGDRPERFAKALASGADALILDLEDSVAADRKAAARQAVAAWLDQERPDGAPCFVRINPLDTEAVRRDVAVLREARPDGLVLPKAEGAAAVRDLASLFGPFCPPILPIATETPAAIFRLGEYVEAADRLAGLTWGAEDLPAAIGATSARTAEGELTPPYQMVRSLTLFAAHAARCAAIETVFPDIADAVGLGAYIDRARRDGFGGMLAIHPSQVALINVGFSPSPEELERARRVVDAFAAAPTAGALRLDGRMIDRPHLVQAERLLARAAARR